MKVQKPDEFLQYLEDYGFSKPAALDLLIKQCYQHPLAEPERKEGSHSPLPPTFDEWVYQRAFKSYCENTSRTSTMEDIAGKTLPTDFGTHKVRNNYVLGPSLSEESLYDDARRMGSYVDTRYFAWRDKGLKSNSAQVVLTSAYPDLKDKEIYITALKKTSYTPAFSYPVDLEHRLDLKGKHFKTKVEYFREAYQRVSKTAFGLFVLLGIGIPNDLKVPKDLVNDLLLFKHIAHSLFLDRITFSTEHEDLSQPLKLTRYFTRKLKMTNDAFTSYVSEMADQTTLFLSAEDVTVSYLNNIGLVEFYADPMGIGSCMTGQNRQHCVDSYRLNPNCGLAVFKKRGKVRARSLVYITDKGIKLHCNIYNIPGISPEDCRTLLKEQGFTNIRKIYGIFDQALGRGYNNEVPKYIFYTHRSKVQEWLNESVLPDDCKKGLQDIIDDCTEEWAADRAPVQGLFEWFRTWFEMTFVTNEDYNIPFLDSFGMWKIVSEGKNMKLLTLPLRNNMGNADWEDMRTASGPGKYYKKQRSRPDPRLFTDDEEYKAQATPRRGYTRNDPGWIKCHHSNKWYNPDYWGTMYIQYLKEKDGIWNIKNGEVLSQYYYTYWKKDVYCLGYGMQSTWATSLVYLKALDSYVRLRDLPTLVSYDETLTEREPHTGMLIITDPNVKCTAYPDFNKQDDTLENTNKPITDVVQVVSVSDLRGKKKEPA